MSERSVPPSPRPDTRTDPLAVAAARALELVNDGSTIGVGAGNASFCFLRLLADRVAHGLRVEVVPASEQTAELAEQLGIPVSEPRTGIDITFDGADEVSPELDLVKGYGGALVRERIVAAASGSQIIIVGPEKLVPVLGSRGRLPVEVVPFALGPCCERLAALGLRPKLRWSTDGAFLTDNCNVILDCAVGPIAAPRALDAAIRAVPGVVDTGLFLGMATKVLIGNGDGLQELTREGRR